MSDYAGEGGVVSTRLNICGSSYTHRQETGKCHGLCGIEDSALVRSEGSPYYGPGWECTNCGDSWDCDWVRPRPFARGWRQEAIRKAVADWEGACACPIERDKDYYPIPCKEHGEVWQP